MTGADDALPATATASAREIGAGLPATVFARRVGAGLPATVFSHFCHCRITEP